LEAMETLREHVGRYAEDHHPTVGIHARVVEGSVVDALVDESHRAELMVLGSRGHHRGPVAIMGSVSRGVAERAACPVVVVHPRDRAVVE
jgi:nucleotide-binding universal stress UspA family protein